METAHLLRKYNPAEWGGTETAVKQLLDGLGQLSVRSKVFAPRLPQPPALDPIASGGHQVARYNAFLPVWGISQESRDQMISIGGNLMSMDLIWKVWSGRFDVIHTHALNRIGGIGLTVARAQKKPFVVTIHGGVLDLPESVRASLAKPMEKAFEWGRFFGALVRSRKTLEEADAILTCNTREAMLLREKYPSKRIITHPHGVPTAKYSEDHRPAALAAYPAIADRKLCLVLGRVDPVKNQGWVLEQAPAIVARHPDALICFVGAVTDELYGKALRKEIRRLGLENNVLMTGGLQPDAPELKGLLQSASVLIVPSLSETFGLVILEAWAAGTAVLTTPTSGALGLVKDGENGCVFDLKEPAQFHQALTRLLGDEAWSQSLAHEGRLLAAREYDTVALAQRVKSLYTELIEAKKQ